MSHLKRIVLEIYWTGGILFGLGKEEETLGYTHRPLKTTEESPYRSKSSREGKCILEACKRVVTAAQIAWDIRGRTAVTWIEIDK